MPPEPAEAHNFAVLPDKFENLYSAWAKAHPTRLRQHEHDGEQPCKKTTYKRVVHPTQHWVQMKLAALAEIS